MKGYSGCSKSIVCFKWVYLNDRWILKASASIEQYLVSSFLLYVTTCLDKDLTFLHPLRFCLCHHLPMPWLPVFVFQIPASKRALSFLKLCPKLTSGTAGVVQRLLSMSFNYLEEQGSVSTDFHPECSESR